MWPPLHHHSKLLKRVAVSGSAAATDGKRPSHLAHVEIRLGIQGKAVWCGEAAGCGAVGCAPARKQLASRIKDTETCMTHSADRAEAVRIVANVPGELGHVDIALSVKREVRWALRVGPLLEEFTVRAEYLNAVDFAIAHEHASISGDRNSVRQPELAGAIAGLAPRALQLPAGGEHVHARIAIA